MSSSSRLSVAFALCAASLAAVVCFAGNSVAPAVAAEEMASKPYETIVPLVPRPGHEKEAGTVRLIRLPSKEFGETLYIIVEVKAQPPGMPYQYVLLTRSTTTCARITDKQSIGTDDIVLAPLFDNRSHSAILNFSPVHPKSGHTDPTPYVSAVIASHYILFSDSIGEGYTPKSRPQYGNDIHACADIPEGALLFR